MKNTKQISLLKKNFILIKLIFFIRLIINLNLIIKFHDKIIFLTYFVDTIIFL